MFDLSDLMFLLLVVYNLSSCVLLKMGAKDTYGSSASRDYRRSPKSNDRENSTNNKSNKMTYITSCPLAYRYFFGLVPLGICATEAYQSEAGLLFILL